MNYKTRDMKPRPPEGSDKAKDWQDSIPVHCGSCDWKGKLGDVDKGCHCPKCGKRGMVTE